MTLKEVTAAFQGQGKTSILMSPKQDKQKEICTSSAQHRKPAECKVTARASAHSGQSKKTMPSAAGQQTEEGVFKALRGRAASQRESYSRPRGNKDPR